MCIQTEWEHYTLRPIKPYACGIGWGSHATAPYVIASAPPCSTYFLVATARDSRGLLLLPFLPPPRHADVHQLRALLNSAPAWRQEIDGSQAAEFYRTTAEKKMHLRMTMSQVCPNLDPPLVVQHHHGKWPISRWFTSYISMSHFPWQTAPETTPPC